MILYLLTEGKNPFTVDYCNTCIENILKYEDKNILIYLDIL